MLLLLNLLLNQNCSDSKFSETVGGCLVTGYNMHRTGGEEASVFQYERNVCSLSHRAKRFSYITSEYILYLH